MIFGVITADDILTAIIQQTFTFFFYIPERRWTRRSPISDFRCLRRLSLFWHQAASLMPTTMDQRREASFAMAALRPDARRSWPPAYQQVGSATLRSPQCHSCLTFYKLSSCRRGSSPSLTGELACSGARRFRVSGQRIASGRFRALPGRLHDAIAHGISPSRCH